MLLDSDVILTAATPHFGHENTLGSVLFTILRTLLLLLPKIRCMKYIIAINGFTSKEWDG